MPIHDLGYRAWTGPLVPQWARFWAITATGMRLVWKSGWLRRLVFAAWLPALYFGVAFLFYEQSMADKRPFEDFRKMVSIAADGGRHAVWSQLLWYYFRYPQGLVMVLLVGLIAPPLIAHDVRSRAFLLYFSKPITRWEYVLGKMGIVWGYLLLISAAPALVLYTIAVLLSPDLSVIGETWDLPLRILAASGLLMVPTTALALAMSSLTAESRYAMFAWFAFWTVGWVTYLVAHGSLGLEAGSLWTFLSLYHTLAAAQGWIFGHGTELADAARAGAVLAGITVVSLAILYRRASAPLRV